MPELVNFSLLSDAKNCKSGRFRALTRWYCGTDLNRLWHVRQRNSGVPYFTAVVTIPRPKKSYASIEAGRCGSCVMGAGSHMKA
jgi:hypothetical protein